MLISEIVNCQDFCRSLRASILMSILHLLQNNIILSLQFWHWCATDRLRWQRKHFYIYKLLISNYCLYLCTVAHACLFVLFYFFNLLTFFCKAASVIGPVGLFWQPVLVLVDTVLCMLWFGLIKIPATTTTTTTTTACFISWLYLPVICDMCPRDYYTRVNLTVCDS